VPEHHVLTKSFYLLRSFPGRWDGGQLWVEAEAEAPRDSDMGQHARRVDGVGSILITSNDLAAAWALDGRNPPLYPVVPGAHRRQHRHVCIDRQRRSRCRPHQPATGAREPECYPRRLMGTCSSRTTARPPVPSRQLW